MSMKGNYKSLFLSYIYTLSAIILILKVSLVYCQNDDPLKYYESLYESKKDSSDCKTDGTDDPNGWGTKKTLQYLSGQFHPDDPSKFPGLVGNNLPKLRVFLARVGYLKAPGSLVFMNKQTETLRLECNNDENAIWRLQGEKGLDAEFREVGKLLKIQAPNSANYIHKFTCLVPSKCSHTFYVITRPLPELPESVELRNMDDMSKPNSLTGKSRLYWLNCAVPYCNVKNCTVGKTTTIANRRAYPPYTIKWYLKSRNNPDEDVKIGKLGVDSPNLEAKNGITVLKNATYNIEVYWEHKVRKSKEDPETDKDNYEIVKQDSELWTDAFGEKTAVGVPDISLYHFNSRIVITKADEKIHNGLYECIIEDANGVVSTPSTFPDPRDWVEYRGRTNLYVLPPYYLYLCFGVSAACIVGVAIIITVCPKKMEHDDGTPYTKEELVSPEKQAAAQEVAATSATSQPDANADNVTNRGKSKATVKENE